MHENFLQRVRNFASLLAFRFSNLIASVKSIRFGRFPVWSHEGWQVVAYFGELPGVEMLPHEMLGWRTLLFGVFKVTSLPENTDEEITSKNIRGFLVQGQIWLPFGKF